MLLTSQGRIISIRENIDLRQMKYNNSVKADMGSRDFVSAFFIAITSGHNVQKWKGRKNE